MYEVMILGLAFCGIVVLWVCICICAALHLCMMDRWTGGRAYTMMGWSLGTYALGFFLCLLFFSMHL